MFNEPTDSSQQYELFIDLIAEMIEEYLLTESKENQITNERSEK